MISSLSFSEMGTKVHCKSYLPGYCSMRDLNEVANNSWPFYYEDTTPSGQFCSNNESFRQMTVNGYSGYNKETLKQTMLKHDGIFRKQVHELHRLYRRQIDLMDELKVKEKCNANCCGTSACADDDPRSHLNLSSHRAMKDGRVPTDSSDSLKNDESTDCKLRKHSGRIIDLQLPADAYIDVEDEKNNEKNIAGPLFGATNSSSVSCDQEPEMKLTLNTGESSTCRGKIWNPDLEIRNGPISHSLTFNEPIKTRCYKEAAVSSSSKCPGVRTLQQEMQEHQFPPRTGLTFQQKDFFRDGHHNEGHVNGGMNSFGQSLSCEKMAATSELEQGAFRKPELPFSLSSQNKIGSWSAEKPTLNDELSGRGSHFASTCYSILAAPPTSSPFSVITKSECANLYSPSVSSWKKSLIPTSDKTLPCFSVSSPSNKQRSLGKIIQASGNSSDNWKCNGNSRPHQSYGSEASSYSNGFHQDFQSESYVSSLSYLPTVSSDKPNLNDCGSSACETSGVHGAQRCFNDVDVKSENHVSSNLAHRNGFRNAFAAPKNMTPGPSWLRATSICIKPVDLNETAEIDTCPTQSCSQIMSSYSPLSQGFDQRKETESHAFLNILQDRMQKSGMHGVTSSTKILGVPILDQAQLPSIIAPSISGHKNSAADGVKKNAEDGFLPIDSSCKVRFLDLEKETAGATVVENRAENSSVGSRHLIDLNSTATSLDGQNSSDDEKQVPPSLFVPNDAGKSTLGIDLEAPVVCQADEHIYLAETSGTNQLFLRNIKEDQLDIEAAGIIVELSVDISRGAETVTPHLSGPASADPLLWFADVVFSNVDDPASALDVFRGDSERDGMDFFEAMTLKLTETKVDYCPPRPLEQDNQNNEETSIPSLLLTKPRKGLARRRRQRRDFQKDILPGLASLSRQEVTEDLQIIGGMMRASGLFWQTSASRRKNTGRNGGNCAVRGRRQLRGAAAVETPLDPSSTQPNNAELEIDGRSIIGWGRTRRCRRQRCPSGNVAAPVT